MKWVKFDSYGNEQVWYSDDVVEKLKAENATYKANADVVQKYITQNEQLKTHIDGLEKKNAELKALISLRDKSVTAQAEIILKLKAENERLKEELTELEEKFLTLNGKSYSYYLTLQEIKEIAEKELSYDMIGNEHRHYRNYDFIRHLITKAESEG